MKKYVYSDIMEKIKLTDNDLWVLCIYKTLGETLDGIGVASAKYALKKTLESVQSYADVSGRNEVPIFLQNHWFTKLNAFLNEVQDETLLYPNIGNCKISSNGFGFSEPLVFNEVISEVFGESRSDCCHDLETWTWDDIIITF